jgi:diguanylate cyclase (GGDEF)-like protein/PAS domain S-box-containing protein
MHGEISTLSLHAFLGSAPLPILALDRAGCVTQWNPAAERAFGWAETEVVGAPPPIVPDEEVAAARDLFNRALAGETFTDVAVRHRAKDGAVLTLSLSLAPLYDNSEQPIGVLCTYLNLAERDRQVTMHRRTADRMAGVVQTQQEIAAGGLDMQSVLDLVVERVRVLTNASSAVVELIDGDSMVYQAVSGTASAHLGMRVKRASSLSGLCVMTGAIQRCDDSETDPRVDREACRLVGARSMLLVPLRHAGTLQGVLKVLSPQERFFTDDDEHTLSLLAGVIGAAMSNAAATEAERRLLEERTSALNIVRESEERFRTLVEKAPIGMCVVTRAGIFQQVNEAYASMLGYTAAYMTGKHFSLIVPQNRLSTMTRMHRKNVANRSEALDDFELLRADGELVTALTTTVPLPSTEGLRATFAINITERKQTERALFQHAHHDGLTGLPNRRLLLDRLTLAVQMAKREGATLAVLFMDLDGFKGVNDQLGHQQGDALLQEVGRRLVQCVRGSDTVARLAGDEFVVMLPRLTATGNATRVAGKLLAAIQRPIILDGQLVRVGMSIGISTFPEHGCDAAELLRRADEAMYRAKQSGKNRWAFAAEESSQIA